MSSNQILASVNSIFQNQETQSSSNIGNFDLSDDRFSNILGGKLDELKTEETETTDIVGQLGVPAGLNIEGFDYNSFANNIDSTDAIDSIGTESNIRDDGKFNAGSFIKDAAEAFTPVVKSIVNSDFNLEPNNASNPVQAVKNFWENQANNFYSIMNKDTVSDISDLISKL